MKVHGGGEESPGRAAEKRKGREAREKKKKKKERERAATEGGRSQRGNRISKISAFLKFDVVRTLLIRFLSRGVGGTERSTKTCARACFRRRTTSIKVEIEKIERRELRNVEMKKGRGKRLEMRKMQMILFFTLFSLSTVIV